MPAPALPVPAFWGAVLPVPVPAHVAGGAALHKATHPTASPSTVKSALQSAGTTNYSSAGDPDGIQEKLLNVATF
ncbi:hypothetical protein [Micromonospora sp. IBHARD004]|uniref:hypothetical protein n=1 Tax=Micromonospora sp. IBHARD004 TaxID=3457764 RepID=UPI00405958BA